METIPLPFEEDPMYSRAICSLMVAHGLLDWCISEAQAAERTPPLLVLATNRVPAALNVNPLRSKQVRLGNFGFRNMADFSQTARSVTFKFDALSRLLDKVWLVDSNGHVYAGDCSGGTAEFVLEREFGAREISSFQMFGETATGYEATLEYVRLAGRDSLPAVVPLFMRTGSAIVPIDAREFDMRVRVSSLKAQNRETCVDIGDGSASEAQAQGPTHSTCSDEQCVTFTLNPNIEVPIEVSGFSARQAGTSEVELRVRMEGDGVEATYADISRKGDWAKTRPVEMHGNEFFVTIPVEELVQSSSFTLTLHARGKSHGIVQFATDSEGVELRGKTMRKNRDPKVTDPYLVFAPGAQSPAKI